MSGKGQKLPRLQDDAELRIELQRLRRILEAQGLVLPEPRSEREIEDAEIDR